jgi:hypothetical protein
VIKTTEPRNVVFPNLRLAVDVSNNNLGDEVWGKFYKRPIVVVELNDIDDQVEWMLTLLGWMEPFTTLHPLVLPSDEERAEAQKQLREYCFVEELKQDTECVD